MWAYNADTSQEQIDGGSLFSSRRTTTFAEPNLNKKKAKRRRCSRVQANVEGLFKYNINLDLVFMANKDQL